MCTIRPKKKEDYAAIFEVILLAFRGKDEAFLVLELIPNALNGIKGRVKYPTQFNEII